MRDERRAGHKRGRSSKGDVAERNRPWQLARFNRNMASPVVLTDDSDDEDDGPPPVAIMEDTDVEDYGPPPVAIRDGSDDEDYGPPPVAIMEGSGDEDDGSPLVLIPPEDAESDAQQAQAAAAAPVPAHASPQAPAAAAAPVRAAAAEAAPTTRWLDSGMGSRFNAVLFASQAVGSREESDPESCDALSALLSAPPAEVAWWDAELEAEDTGSSEQGADSRMSLPAESIGSRGVPAGSCGQAARWTALPAESGRQAARWTAPHVGSDGRAVGRRPEAAAPRGRTAEPTRSGGTKREASDMEDDEYHEAFMAEQRVLFEQAGQATLEERRKKRKVCAAPEASLQGGAAGSAPGGQGAGATAAAGGGSAGIGLAEGAAPGNAVGAGAGEPGGGGQEDAAPGPAPPPPSAVALGKRKRQPRGDDADELEEPED